MIGMGNDTMNASMIVPSSRPNISDMKGCRAMIRMMMKMRAMAARMGPTSSTSRVLL